MIVRESPTNWIKPYYKQTAVETHAYKRYCYSVCRLSFPTFPTVQLCKLLIIDVPDNIFLATLQLNNHLKIFCETISRFIEFVAVKAYKKLAHVSHIYVQMMILHVFNQIGQMRPSEEMATNKLYLTLANDET